MKLTFRTIKGSTFNVEAEPTTTVGELKSSVESSQGEAFPKEQLKLVYKGKVLDDDAKAVSEYSVDETGFLVVFVQKAVTKPAAAAATGTAGASSSAPAAAAPAAEVRTVVFAASRRG
jgi:UV excision repair protein RAD23